MAEQLKRRREASLSDQRVSWVAEWRGFGIRVVTGYDITSNKWPVHVYIRPPGAEFQILKVSHVSASEAEALDAGLWPSTTLGGNWRSPMASAGA
jgi:hypothetical protein